VDVVFALIAFFALVAAWFVLPAAPRTTLRVTAKQQPTAPAESLAPAA
jgi:hypothetical protein